MRYRLALLALGLAALAIADAPPHASQVAAVSVVAAQLEEVTLDVPALL